MNPSAPMTACLKEIVVEMDYLTLLLVMQN
jgi:hypothetical protein